MAAIACMCMGAAAGWTQLKTDWLILEELRGGGLAGTVQGGLSASNTGDVMQAMTEAAVLGSMTNLIVGMIIGTVFGTGIGLTVWTGARRWRGKRAGWTRNGE